MPPASDKQTLLTWLQTALELELATIPPYMVALLSIQLPGNRASAEIIRSVMIEEMLHLVLIANVINAIGGAPRINQAAVPSYPLQMQFEGKPFAHRRFAIDLAPFSAAAISTFLRIELPHGPPQLELLEARLIVPALTIGEFYGRIVSLLAQLDGRGSLFTGDPTRQIGEDFYWSGGGEGDGPADREGCARTGHQPGRGRTRARQSPRRQVEPSTRNGALFPLQGD